MLRVTYESPPCSGPGAARPDSPDQPGAPAGQPRQRGAWSALSRVPLTVMGGQAGVLQGERRWAPLAVVYLAAGVPRLLVGSALVRVAADRARAMVGVAARRLRAGRWSAASRCAGPASEHDHGGGPADPVAARRGRPQLPGAAGLLRPLQRRHRGRPQRARRPRRRPVRRRPDPDQGRAVPAAVRGRGGVPGDVHPPRATPGPGPRPGSWSPASASSRSPARTCSPAWRWSSSAATSTPTMESRLWLFAVLGTLLSMLQLLVYAVLARQGRRSRRRAVGRAGRWSSGSASPATASVAARRRGRHRHPAPRRAAGAQPLTWPGRPAAGDPQ